MLSANSFASPRHRRDVFELNARFGKSGMLRIAFESPRGTWCVAHQRGLFLPRLELFIILRNLFSAMF